MALKEKIIKDLNNSLEESGLAPYVEYAVLTGSFVLTNNINSDLDLIVA